MVHDSLLPRVAIKRANPFAPRTRHPDLSGKAPGFGNPVLEKCIENCVPVHRFLCNSGRSFRERVLITLGGLMEEATGSVRINL